MRLRKRKRYAVGDRRPLPKPDAANRSWSMDFVSDGLADASWPMDERCAAWLSTTAPGSAWRSKSTPRSPDVVWLACSSGTAKLATRVSLKANLGSCGSIRALAPAMRQSIDTLHRAQKNGRSCEFGAAAFTASRVVGHINEQAAIHSAKFDKSASTYPLRERSRQCQARGCAHLNTESHSIAIRA